MNCTTIFKLKTVEISNNFLFSLDKCRFIILLILVNLITNISKAQVIKNDSIFINNKLVGELINERNVDTTLMLYNTNLSNFVSINCQLSYYKIYIDEVLNKSQFNSILFSVDSFFEKKSSTRQQFKYQIEKRYKNANKLNIAGSYLSAAGKLKNLKATILLASIASSTAVVALTPNYIVGLGLFATGGIISIILEYKSNRLLVKAGDLMLCN